MKVVEEVCGGRRETKSDEEKKMVTVMCDKDQKEYVPCNLRYKVK